MNQETIRQRLLHDGLSVAFLKLHNLRDDFAKSALNALIIYNDFHSENDMLIAVKRSYKYADAMLEQKFK